MNKDGPGTEMASRSNSDTRQSRIAWQFNKDVDGSKGSKKAAASAEYKLVTDNCTLVFAAACELILPADDEESSSEVACEESEDTKQDGTNELNRLRTWKNGGQLKTNWLLVGWQNKANTFPSKSYKVRDTLKTDSFSRLSPPTSASSASSLCDSRSSKPSLRAYGYACDEHPFGSQEHNYGQKSGYQGLASMWTSRIYQSGTHM